MKRAERRKSSERKQSRRKLNKALEIPKGRKRLFVIQAAVEVRSEAELAELMNQFSGVLCPVPPETNHRCARRWMLISHPADSAERLSWEPLLNDS